MGTLWGEQALGQWPWPQVSPCYPPSLKLAISLVNVIMQERLASPCPCFSKDTPTPSLLIRDPLRLHPGVRAESGAGFVSGKSVSAFQ